LLVGANRRGARRRALACTVGIPALLVAPWLLGSWIRTGNPIYPNLHRVLGGRFWSDVQQMQFAKSLAVAGGLDKSWLDYLMLPLRLPFDEERFYCPPFSLALMALLVLALLLPASWRATGWVVVTPAILGFVAWASSVQHARYLVAFVPVMILAAMQALAPLKHSRAGLALVAVAVAGVGGFQLQGRIPGPSVARDLVTGPRASLLARNGNYDVCEYLDREQGGKVLALWENRFFFLERPFQSDSLYEAPTNLAWLRRTDDAATFARELREQGFTQVVINTAPMKWYFEDRLPMSILDERIYPAARLARDFALLERFIADHLIAEYRQGTSVVFRIRSPEPARSTL
jgi:hypothetical protein